MGQDTSSIAVIAYGDDNTTQEKDGFASGEEIKWKIFDCSEMEEHLAFATYDPTFPNHDGMFAVFGLSSLLSLETVICQTLSLASGWNGVSLFIEPTDPDVENIFLDYVADLIIMQSLTSVYWPAIPVNTIGDWDLMTGYAIKMASEHQIELCGAKLSDRSITLLPGWHYLPVLSECVATTTEIFDPLQDKIVFAKELIGTKVYWPGPGVYTLQELVPGSAYAIKVSEEVTLTFPICAKDDWVSKSTINEMNTPWGHFDLKLETHAISIPKSIFNGFSKSDDIGVFDENGYCYGYLKLEENENSVLLLNGDDELTPNKDGFTQNEPLEFRSWKAETGEEFLLDVSFDQSMPNTELVFNNHGLSAITEMKYSVSGISGLYDDMNIRIIPNPARDEFMLSPGSENFSEGKLTIYKLDGQKAGVKKIFERNTKIDISKLTPGIYILNIEIDGNFFNKRLVKH